jgi:hypothetical protein
MIDEYGAAGGMRINRGSLSALREPAPVPLCPPQIPHNMTCVLTRAADQSPELPELRHGPVSSYNIGPSKVIKPKKMKLARHVESMGEMKNPYKVYQSEGLKGRDHLGDIRVDKG